MSSSLTQAEGTALRQDSLAGIQASSVKQVCTPAQLSDQPAVQPPKMVSDRQLFQGLPPRCTRHAPSI